MKEDMEVPGQNGLFEYLKENNEKISENPIEIKGVIDINTFSDFSVQSTYRDIFMIINMLDDYVTILRNSEMHRDYYSQYMIRQFERISTELSEQINLDKEKMYRKCRKMVKQDSIGEDAMVLAVKGK